MTTVAWWHCFAGIAGDMALGSLVDAGADLALIERELVALPVGGWRIEAEPTTRGGIACTHVRVETKESTVVRTHGHIVGLITEARLPDRARDRALATFARLAEVEGRLHRRPPAQVHFHEVGGVDAIVDIVGTCVALELLGVDEIWSSPVAQGTGMVRSAHGSLPVPVPAVVELLKGAPTYGTAIPLELTTPTGAALLAALAKGFGPLPAMEIQRSGFGAGTRQLDGMPNAVQVVIGTRDETPQQEGQPVVVLEANLDDVTGEVLGHAVEALVAAGAWDAWITPIVGKKGRPAHILTALGDPVAVGRLRDVIASETGSLGVRSSALQRWVAERRVSNVEVDGLPVRVKHGPHRIKAEYDDTVKVGARLSLPPREVARRAEEVAYHEQADAARPPPPDPPAPGGVTGEPAPDVDVVVTWTVPAAEAEARAADLWAAGATAVEWQEPRSPDEVTLVAGYPTPDAARAVARELGAETREIDEAAWRDVWKQFAQPIEVTPHLVIAPAWRPVPLNVGSKDRIVIEIDPGPCFGSGSHPSTRLLLAALAKRPPVGQRVLDVGTGSGILAVAAACLGASRVVAVDIDPAAIEVTAANAARNRVSHLLHPSTTDVGHLDEAFSLLLVNVTAGVHAAIGRHVVERAAPEATLLLAGLLPNQWRHVAAAYPGCTVVDRPQLDGWEGVVLRRR